MVKDIEEDADSANLFIYDEIVQAAKKSGLLTIVLRNATDPPLNKLQY